MSTETVNAVLLIRVSDPRQEKEGLSLDNQEQVLRRYALEEGFTILKEFRFQESADLKIRKRFQEMVKFVRARNDVRAIIGYRVDRMTRNFHDHVLLDELRLHHEKELHFVHDRLVITPQSVGREIQDWDTKVYLAKMYLNRLKEDATISSAYKLSRGEWPGKAPFGYCNTKLNGRSWIEPDSMAPIVVHCFELYESGALSMEQVRVSVKTTFGLNLSKGKLDFILKNRFYYGEMVQKGRRYGHVYEPLITRSQFERVMAVKESFHKKSYTFAGLPYLYRGLVHCATCGCMITPETKRKQDGRTYIYYHCTQYHQKHRAHWLREEDLTTQFAKIFDGLKIPREDFDFLVTSLRESHESKIEYAATARSNLQLERDKYEKRLATLYEDRLDSVITKDVYAAKRHDYEERIKEVDGQLLSIAEADDEYYMTASAILELFADAGELFHEANETTKRMILKLRFFRTANLKRARCFGS